MLLLEVVCLKVVVYAICKNEEKFVSRWVESVLEADEIVVLDTGSTDHSVEKLRSLGVKVVEKEIKPWRFDVARNESLALVDDDADICVCLDLDEVIEKGWRNVLEDCFAKEKPTRVSYLYHWKLDQDDRPLVSFWIDKIHIRNHYSWKNAVHEVLVSDQEEKIVEVPIVVKHYPDVAKSREQYLPLLEQSVQEDPQNDRNLHYLGREYMYKQRWEECIKTLHQHLRCKNATWKDERCASMRFMARAYFALEYKEEAEFWWRKATKEAPYLREGYVELADFLCLEKRYDEAYEMMHKAFAIKEKSKSYINEEFAWNDTFYDLFSIVSFYSGHQKEALSYVQKALEFNPFESRYQKNLEFMQ